MSRKVWFWERNFVISWYGVVNDFWGMNLVGDRNCDVNDWYGDYVGCFGSCLEG